MEIGEPGKYKTSDHIFMETKMQIVTRQESTGHVESEVSAMTKQCPMCQSLRKGYTFCFTVTFKNFILS